MLYYAGQLLGYVIVSIVKVCGWTVGTLAAGIIDAVIPYVCEPGACTQQEQETLNIVTYVSAMTLLIGLGIGGGFALAALGVYLGDSVEQQKKNKKED